jgi:hypothetical protein
MSWRAKASRACCASLCSSPPSGAQCRQRERSDRASERDGRRAHQDQSQVETRGRQADRAPAGCCKQPREEKRARPFSSCQAGGEETSRAKAPKNSRRSQGEAQEGGAAAAHHNAVGLARRPSSETGLSLQPLRGAVRVHDAEEPERPATDFQRHADDGPDEAQIEIETEKLEGADADEKCDAFLVVSKVEVPASRNHRQRGSEQRVLGALGPADLVATRGASAAPRAGCARIRQYGAAMTAQELGCHL